VTAVAERQALGKDARPSTRRTLRAAWHRNRAAFTAIAGTFGLAAIVLLIEGAWMRHDIGHRHLDCLSCDPPAVYTFLDGGWHASDLELALALIPLLVAVFAGLPWLTREFEFGAFRYTWTQEAGRARWLLGTFVPLTVLAAIGAAALSAAFGWWYPVAQWTMPSGPGSGWDPLTFGLSPELLVPFTVLAMSLALLSGLAIRRTVPAMGATAAACAACYALAQWPLRDWLIRRAPAITKGTYQMQVAPHWNDLLLRSFITAPGGRVAETMTAGGSQWWSSPRLARELGGLNYSQALSWLARHHYTDWIVYQPHSRLAAFELTEAGLVLVFTAVIISAALMLFFRRT
jgi:hypothetical protein